MPQIFSRKFNYMPLISLGASLGGGLLVIFLVWYYFSPEYLEVGYAPNQPVAYSHQIHVGKLGMDCQYCHNWVETSSWANVPSTQTCMNCHTQVRANLATIVPIRESWTSGKPIKWTKVHFLPDYVRFSHSMHVNNGVGCETCHGRIDQMTVVKQSEPLSMGWCLECHRQPELYLRPNEEVTTMGYRNPADYVSRNLERIRAETIQPPTNCSGCHY